MSHRHVTAILQSVHHRQYRERPIFQLSGRQDGRSCKWVSRNENRPIEEIFDWPIDCSSLKDEKVVIWGVKMMATLWQCTCSVREIKTWRPISQNAAHYQVDSRINLNRMRAHGLWNGRIQTQFRLSWFIPFPTKRDQSKLIASTWKVKFTLHSSQVSTDYSTEKCHLRLQLNPKFYHIFLCIEYSNFRLQEL